jgi:hypothetical protein
MCNLHRSMSIARNALDKESTAHKVTERQITGSLHLYSNANGLNFRDPEVHTNRLKGNEMISRPLPS